MKSKAKSYEMDMAEGALFPKIMRFTVPVILSGLLQLFYNAADMIIVGKFAGDTALGAVGSTGSLINLIVSLFIGLSIGVSVTVANHYGAREFSDVKETVHTSIAMGLAGGLAIGAFGFFMAHRFLLLMGSPPDVIGQASRYLRIYFIGVPFMMVYNFGAAVLRAVGDTRRPMLYLVISGFVNVVFNIIFVVGFKMDVEGVAWPTVISQAISACLVVICLLRSTGCYRLIIRDISFHPKKIAAIAKVGLPAGIQSTIFSISNVLIQSSVNSFGSVAVAGNAAAANLEGFIYVGMNSIAQSCLTFTSQNVGAKKYERIDRICLECNLLVAAVGAALGMAVYFLRAPLLSLYTDLPEVIELGGLRIGIIATTYFICGSMDVFVGSIRGMGRAVTPMIVSVFGACVLRIIWIYTVFAVNRTLPVLYVSYPVSWFITTSAHFICYRIIKKRLTSSGGQLNADLKP